MTYELVGTPQVRPEYSDKWETTMTCDVVREDGVFGREVWIVAGVPDYQRGSATAAASHRGYETVRVFGDLPEHWCPGSFMVSRDPNCQTAEGIPEEYGEIRDGIIAAVSDAALAVHRAQVAS